MKRLKFVLFILITTIIGLYGCSFGKTSPDSRSSMIQSINPEPKTINGYDPKKVELAERVKKDIQSLDEIYDVAVIVGEEETLVAYKVKHLKRFYMKKIEKAINEKLEENYPEDDFIVSSDFKIFIECIELLERMKDPTYSTQKADKQLKRIIELKKEMT